MVRQIRGSNCKICGREGYDPRDYTNSHEKHRFVFVRVISWIDFTQSRDRLPPPSQLASVRLGRC
jgi:hypothetical protein